jgi:Zn-dependent M28 family amino/carboxypeptidase
MAVLVLALNLARLFETKSYEKYRYRVRFCWWGAEEDGMLGSEYHLTAFNENPRSDYLLMLNFDMLASSNYYFGIYESDSLPSSISPQVKHGSKKISQLFRHWFDQKNLPWDNSSLTIESDHVPFLKAGIACGGTFSGSNGVKTTEQHDRYEARLGTGQGGTTGAPFDPCYHKHCDTIENINIFAYETMTRAAAHVLETLARIPNLRRWLLATSSEAPISTRKG